MESKRKVNGAHALDIDERSAKRRRLPTDLTDETPETTAEKGLAFVEHLKKTTDKSGRLVATNFLTLPNKRQLPDYYKIIKMPVALDTIQEKLMRREFPTLSAVESYFKRMIANAKEYNQKGSEIYDDAERIRKALSNYMTKNNPAYKTPGYVALPAPIPPELLEKSDSEADAEGEPEEDEVEATPQARRGPGRPPKTQQAQRSSTTPATSEQQYDGVGFDGLTFQQAQEKIVADMIRYKEDPDDEYAAFEVFINLPPRSLKDYYQIIPYPVSLKKLQKRVKGIHGRADATGVSDFKTWAAFEEEASYIWKNAWHYNEDGSEISNLAKELETFFHKALQEAKKVVPEPVSTKIKLRTGAQPDRPSPKITLHLSGKASPAGSPAPQQNGVNGAGAAANGTSRKFALTGSGSGTPSLDQLERTRSMSGSAASPTPSQSATVKREDGISPAPASVLSNQASSTQESQTGMLQRTASGMSQSPYPQTGFAHSFPHTPIYHSPNPSYESKWRQPGKTAADAMIMNLSLATHPGLNIARHFRMDLPPSPTMVQQSITINLPSTHYYLQIKPTIAPSLLERQHKLFVTSGTQRLHAMPTIPGHSVDPRHPLFEARLLPGVNRIEIELIAALPKGSAKPANGQDVELEKITVFANLMKS
ncbi:Bromodomain-containing protein-like protein [Xylogone sp. PMI_703]|nr:Bromodomain-containing protein-like protein [Xylogone sp. PMI_703]